MNLSTCQICPYSGYLPPFSKLKKKKKFKKSLWKVWGLGWFDFAADPFPCPYLPSFIMVNVYKSTNTWYLSVLISVVIVELRFFFFFTRITFFKIQRLIYNPTIHIRLNAPTFTGVDMYILLQMDPYRSRAIFFFFQCQKIWQFCRFLTLVIMGFSMVPNLHHNVPI